MHIMLKNIRKISFFLTRYIRSAIAGFLMVFLGSLLFLPLLLCMLIPIKYRYNRVLFFLLYCFYRVCSYALFLPITIKGKRNLISNQPAIIAANHQSSLDIPLLGLLVGAHPHIWLVLNDYIKTPLLGLIIKKFFIAVDQENKRSAALSFRSLLDRASTTKGHILIFPEGGRYVDGKIHPFFLGFALLAEKTGRPVIPVFMPHNGDALYPKDILLSYAPLKIIIGKPFVYEIDDTKESFTERVHAWFVEENNKIHPLEISS